MRKAYWIWTAGSVFVAGALGMQFGVPWGALAFGGAQMCAGFVAGINSAAKRNSYP